VKRVATGQSFDAEPAAANQAVTFNSVVHVFRAGGIKAAGGWQERRHHYLIYAEESAKGSGRESGDWALEERKENSFAISDWSSGNGISREDRRGLMTTFHGLLSLSNWSRTASRNRRLTRLRTFARPSARGVVKPILGPGLSGLPSR
jgi:hypothetical protein